MRRWLIALVVSMVLALSSGAVLAVAGDDWPEGGSLPGVTVFAGDDWPEGG